MNLREKRNQTADDISQGKFIAKVLKEAGNDINSTIDKTMSSAGFSQPFWQDKKMSIRNGNTLEYRHKPQHRFVDMKTRKTNQGVIRKKRHVVHNKIIYGYLNEIAHQLSFGYTEAVIAELKKLED